MLGLGEAWLDAGAVLALGDVDGAGVGFGRMAFKLGSLGGSLSDGLVLLLADTGTTVTFFFTSYSNLFLAKAVLSTRRELLVG